jgi:hypothetical protein
VIAGDGGSLWEEVSACWSRCYRGSMDGAESRSKGCHVGVFESYCALEVAITGKEAVIKSGLEV